MKVKYFFLIFSDFVAFWSDIFFWNENFLECCLLWKRVIVTLESFHYLASLSPLMHRRTHTHKHTHTHSPTYTRVHTHALVFTHSHTHTLTHTHTDTLTHSHTHAHTHTHRHSHTLWPSCHAIVVGTHNILEKKLLFLLGLSLFPLWGKKKITNDTCIFLSFKAGTWNR